LPDGYGALVEALATGLDVQLGCVVRRVDWSAKSVNLRTDRGGIEARHAIIAVPTSVLACGGIAFPPDADDHLHAAAELPLGHVEKLFLTNSDPESVPANAHLIGNPRSADSGSYMLRPLGIAVIESFFGGDWLKDAEADDLVAKAREELGNLLGAGFARRLTAVAHSDWKSHEFICGSYSYARPGQHGARAELAAPVDGPIAFAGEACPEADYATVHGAFDSGREAVRQLYDRD
jgi:monoamine oxidase